MYNHTILSHTAHRPYPLPKGPWIMKQVWEDLLFAHWRVDEAELLPYIPPGLTLEKWEGHPWISVTPFRVHPLRLRAFPAIPGINHFLELNIRTYVVCNGKPGVFFLNLDASNPLAVAGARTFAHLPYRYAKMQVHSVDNAIHFTSVKTDSYGETIAFKGVYQPLDSSIIQVMPGTQIHWLTERYCLYAADRKAQLYIGEIHHLPWPLQKAKLDIETNTSTVSLGLVHDMNPSHLTYTRHLEVLIWPLKKVRF
ncbi:MAG: DUF2071 domain-containing protein [Paenibacillus sp.]|nr:DUF2071 domain-containing protein [Paenibacillus sp.]